MTEYCKVDDLKATVYINYPNKDVLKFDSPPINISLTANTSGNTITFVGDYEQNHIHHPGYIVSYKDVNGLPSDRYSTRLIVCVNGTCGAPSPNKYGETFYALHILKNGSDLGNPFYPTGFYSASIRDIDYSSAGEYILKVVDRNLSTITKTYTVEPQYTVACGEECPPGTTKCLSTNYPGYCCLPCESTKAEIRAMTQQVRRLNRG